MADQMPVDLAALPTRTKKVLAEMGLTSPLAVRRALIIGALRPGEPQGFGKKFFDDLCEKVGYKPNPFKTRCPNCLFQWGTDPREILQLVFSNRCTVCRQPRREDGACGCTHDYMI